MPTSADSPPSAADTEAGPPLATTESRTAAPSVTESPSVTDVSANETVVTEGRPFAITARVENPTGDRASVPVRLSLFGEVVEEASVSVPPGDRRDVRFVKRIEAPGEYTATVNGEAVDIVVRPAGAPDPGPTGASPDALPARERLSFLGTPLFAIVVPLVLGLLVCLRMVG